MLWRKSYTTKGIVLIDRYQWLYCLCKANLTAAKCSCHKVVSFVSHVTILSKQSLVLTQTQGTRSQIQQESPQDPTVLYSLSSQSPLSSWRLCCGV